MSHAHARVVLHVSATQHVYLTALVVTAFRRCATNAERIGASAQAACTGAESNMQATQRRHATQPCDKAAAKMQPQVARRTTHCRKIRHCCCTSVSDCAAVERGSCSANARLQICSVAEHSATEAHPLVFQNVHEDVVQIGARRLPRHGAARAARKGAVHVEQVWILHRQRTS